MRLFRVMVLNTWESKDSDALSNGVEYKFPPYSRLTPLPYQKQLLHQHSQSPP